MPFDPSTAVAVGGSGFDPSSATPVDDQGDGLLKNFAAGVGEGVTAGAGMLMDTINPAMTINRGIRDLSHQLGHKSPIPDDMAQGSGHLLNMGLGFLGLNPENVQAKTFPQKLARGAGQGVTALVAPEAEGATVANLFSKGLSGMTSGMAATTAAEAAPDRLKPLAALIGGLTPAGIETLASRAKTAARSAIDPIAASVSEPTAQRLAGTVIKKSASKPQTVADMLAPKPQPVAQPFTTNPAKIADEHALDVARLESEGAAAAAGQPRPTSTAQAQSPLRTVQDPNELVPGSQPTTFQLTGDVGLGSLERGVATRNPEMFAQRRGEQNAARLSVLNTLQSGGSAADVAGAFRNQLDELDQQTAAHAHDMLTQAQTRAQALGGAGTPEHYGDALRTIAKQADEASRERESALWQAVDPKGDMTGNVTQTRKAAQDIADKVSDYAKPMSGEEASIFQAAKGMKAVQPVQDLIALRSRVSTEMRNELASNGKSPSYSRLARLRGAIQDNLSSTISDAAENDQAMVAAGEMPTEESIASRLEGWRNEWVDQRAAQMRASGGGVGGGSPGVGSTVTSGSLPGASPSGPGFYDAAGNNGLGEAGVPTFDADAAGRLKAATAATREQRGTFSRGPVGQVLARAGMQDLFKLPEARVPEKFFHPGPAGFTDATALVKAVGQDKAMPLLTDYAAASLRKAALRDDGTIDPAKFSRWNSAHADALRALPAEVRGQFTNAAKATQALEEASAARQLAIKAANAGALGRLMGATTAEDATRHIASIFGTKDSVATMRQIAKTVGGDPAAVAGLRQAVADYMAQKFISNTEAGTSGQNAMKSDMFQSFLKNNRAALGQVFDSKEMANIQAIADDLHRANRSITAIKLPGGSNTAQDILAAKRAGGEPSKLRRIVYDTLAGGVGFGTSGPVGALAAGLGTHALQAAREAGLQRVDQLVAKAMLDPDFARELLMKAPKDVRKGDLFLAKSIRRSLAGSVAPALSAISRSGSANSVDQDGPRKMPTVGVLPGQLHLDANLAPQVPAGAPRPFAPGEYLSNPDGSWSSEITVTVTNPDINNGRPTVLPSLWIRNGKPVRVTEDQAVDYANASGLTFPSYKSIAEAERAANGREDKWEGLSPDRASSVPPLWVSK